MGTDIRRRRIRRAFEEHEESKSSPPSFERGIGRLPKRRRESKEDRVSSPNSNSRKKTDESKNQRPVHPIESRLNHNGVTILKALARHGGYMPLGDHSSPQEISREFGMSKRVFKQAIGHLWKLRKIDILPNDGIRIKKRIAKTERQSPRQSPSSTKRR
jgi:hypothetical protein